MLGLGQRRPPPPLPYSPPNCRTPLGVTQWLAAAPVKKSQKKLILGGCPSQKCRFRKFLKFGRYGPGPLLHGLMACLNDVFPYVPFSCTCVLRVQQLSPMPEEGQVPKWQTFSLTQGWRFCDDDLNASYRKEKWLQFSLLPTKIYFLYHTCFGIFSLMSYWSSEHPLAFYLYFIQLGMGLFCFLLLLHPVTREYREIILLIAICIFEAWNCTVCHIQAGEWFVQYTADHFYVPDYTDQQVTVIHKMARELTARVALNSHLVRDVPQVFAILFVSPDIVVGILTTMMWSFMVMVSPNIPMGLGVWSFIARLVLSGFYLPLGYWTKKIVQQNYKAELDLQKNLEASQKAVR